jgi:hypothetical protein
VSRERRKDRWTVRGRTWQWGQQEGGGERRTGGAGSGQGGWRRRERLERGDSWGKTSSRTKERERSTSLGWREREVLESWEAGTHPLFSYGISSAPPFPANLRGPLPINGNTLTGECPTRCHSSTSHCPLRPLYFSPLQCLLPKQIFPYITTPPSTRLIEFTVRPHLTLPAEESNKIPRLQMYTPITLSL